MSNPNFIKTVRGLDQSGPGPNGEGLQTLWNCLAAPSDSTFHAAEESTLRWLLKSMNGPSPAAELVRRYPLTWTVLDRVFQRIPLFSLAKSLADRRFLAVLQQTLGDISKPAAEPRSAASSKRKRTSAVSYDEEALRAPAGCIESARSVFRALKSLLDRLDNPDLALTRDNVGAQHIKSLFCGSATEAAAIVAPALTVCSILATSDRGNIEGAESWIDIISSVWDLHLQGGDDEVVAAVHLFRPSTLIMGSIGSFPSDAQAELPEALKARWRSDLETFMWRILVIPARAAFMAHRVFEAYTQALEVTKKIAQLSAPALYFLSCISSRAADSELRRHNVEWLNRVFQAIELVVRGRPDACVLLRTILRLAADHSIPVDVQDLRRVCRDYALKNAETDWELLAKTAACDPDVFQLSDEGVELRREVCDRILNHEATEVSREPIAKTIRAIMDGFRTRRSLSKFLQLWYEQLCEAERQHADQRSSWFDASHSACPTQCLDLLIETELSASQLLEVVAWVATQSPTNHPRSTCVFAAAIAQALRSEAYADAVGTRLFDLVAPVDGSAPASALKWSVVASTMSWVASDERLAIWASVKDQLSNILKTMPITSNITFEAAKCCYRAWDSLSLDDAHVDEPASAMETFTERLDSEMADRFISDKDEHFFNKPDTRTELCEASAYQQYLSWYVCGSSRFNKLYYSRKGGMPMFLSNALSNRNDGANGSEALWRALLRNEVNCNESTIAKSFIDCLIVALEGFKEKRVWPGRQSLLAIKIIASIPIEAFDRAQRERLMSFIRKRHSSMAKSAEQVPVSSWKSVLSLATKLMGRSTFYPGMSFSDLVATADAISRISVEPHLDSKAAIELIERFSLMASATIKQMSENIDERSIKYFSEAAGFVADCEARSSANSASETAGSALYMTLLKALAAELARSPNWQNHQEVSALGINSKTVLGSCIMNFMRRLMSEKKWPASCDTTIDLGLFAAVDAAVLAGDFTGQPDFSLAGVEKLEKRSRRMMRRGDVRGWKVQAFLLTYLSAVADFPRPTNYGSLLGPHEEPLLKELVAATTRTMSDSARLQYLSALLDGFKDDADTDGQVLAIQTVVEQILDSGKGHGHDETFSLAAAHSELTMLLLQKPAHARHICRILRALLEKRPQAMGQWNVEITLSTVCNLCVLSIDKSTVPFVELCKLVEIVIRKHRLRLEGHYHILLSAMQALLGNLVIKQIPAEGCDERGQVSKAHAYARLVNLVCEPTAGAVSHSQLHSALDSATDAAKRSAGRHMFLVLMQYVKLQLEENVPRAAREALEPAMNSIFDITPPEGRKILNDSMDDSGRAILREMFKRYVKFGKWSGV